MSLSFATRPRPLEGARDLGGKGVQVAWALAVAGLWCWTFRHLAIAWRSNPSYEYGYAVPWIAIYLAWRRMQDGRNDVAVPTTNRRQSLSAFLCLLVAWGSFLLAELLLAQILPPSRVPGWLLTFASTLLTGVWLFRSGGKRLLETLAFPLAFTWLAVQWPGQMEAVVTLKLKALVTGVSACALNSTGIFALQRGNVLELTNASVGVDTACSGMTSLQSSLMATVFLGEYFGLSLLRRVLLPVLGALVAIGANCARVYALSAIADAAGESALEHYHDLLGRTETIVIMVLIFIVALALAPRKGVRRGMKKEEAEATRIFLLRAGSFEVGTARCWPSPRCRY